ncbi:MAG: hypothetical protein HYR48_05355 [Gemmatimonadetes bacterium]|nr:hypothetical protein [Gemmatimonadota bacterium]
MMRAGAWYPVVADNGEARVVLRIGERRVAVPRRLLEFRDSRPIRFTVVNRTPDDPNPARGTPADLGRTYGVCPACGSRLALYGAPPVATCRACGHRGEVAWWETG